MFKALSQSLTATLLLAAACTSSASSVTWNIFDPAIPDIDSGVTVTCPDNTTSQLTNGSSPVSCTVTTGASSTIKLALTGSSKPTCEAVLDSSGNFDNAASSCKPVYGPLSGHVLTFSAAQGITPPISQAQKLAFSFANADAAGLQAACTEGCANITSINNQGLVLKTPLTENGSTTLTFTTGSTSCVVSLVDQFIDDRNSTCQSISLSTLAEGNSANTLSFPAKAVSRTRTDGYLLVYPDAIPGTAGTKSNVERQLTFVNQCDQPVWFNLIAGTASINNSSATSGKSVSKAKAQCVKDGTSLGTCPSGTSCRYTSKIEAYCYFDSPSMTTATNPLDTWKLDAVSTAGGTSSQTVKLPVYDDSNIIFSGGASARIGCTDNDGNYLPECAIGNCNNSRNALGCGFTNGTENGSTIAEFTLQKDAMDFYDISVINGAHIPVSMTPAVGIHQAEQSQPSSVVGYYWCGTPGSTDTASTANQQQPGCDWQFKSHLPHSDVRKTVKGRSVTEEVLKRDAYYYINVSAPENSSSLKDVTWCNADYTCGNNQSCGLSLELISNLGNADLKTLFKREGGPFICGEKLGITTPVNACSLLSGIDDDYLNCNNTVQPVIPGTITRKNNSGTTTSLTFTNLYSCNGNTDNCIKGSDAYAAEGKVCCGCTTWHGTNSQIQSGQTTACSFNGTGTNTNKYWDGTDKDGADVKGKIEFLKQGCPTAYAYQFDDATSTFNCNVRNKPKKRGDKSSNINATNYTITFCPAQTTLQ